MNHTISPLRGANALTQAFHSRNQVGGKVLIPYIMAGDPDMHTSESIILALAEIGADIIELGMPFSDPLADGPVIQRAGQRALHQGITLTKLLQSAKRLRAQFDTPMVIMTYYNLFYRFGLDAFARAAADAGIDGVIIPDLPLEEAREFQAILDREGLAMIFLIAPTSTDDRIQQIVQIAKGFVYYVSRTGITGEQNRLAEDIQEKVERIRKFTHLPVAVGFGISNAEQAKEISRYAHGVVIGSAIVRLIEEAQEKQDLIAAEFVKPIIEALHQNA